MRNAATPSLTWLRHWALLLVLVVGQAQAAIYVGGWDPPFGAPFGNLGWRGIATYDVDDNCIVANGVVTFPSGCGPATVTSAQVEFYDNSDPYKAMVAQLSFTPSMYSLAVSAMQFTAGELSDLETSWSDFVDPAPAADALGVAGVEFALFFTLNDGPRLVGRSCTFSAATHYNYSEEPVCTYKYDTPSDELRFEIKRVPEPGTLALACVALLGLAPRRVRQAMIRRRR